MDSFNKDAEDEEFQEDKQFVLSVVADLVPRPESKHATDSQLEMS